VELALRPAAAQYLSRGTANSVDLTHWPEEKLNLELFQETWNIELLLITLAAACCTTDQS
jgi:hypothetical protein